MVHRHKDKPPRFRWGSLRQGPIDGFSWLLACLREQRFRNVCLTPNRSMKTVYHLSLTGFVSTGTLLPYTTSTACSCWVMLWVGIYKGGQSCRQAPSLRNAFFYLGLFAKKVPVLRGRCSFPLVTNSRCQCYQVSKSVKLSGFRLGGATLPFSLFTDRTLSYASEVSKLRISL